MPYWALGMIQPSCWVNFLIKWGCRGHWGHWGCWGHRGCRGCRGDNTWKITTEDFSAIHVLIFSLTSMFWRKKKWGRIRKYHVEVLHPFCQRLLRPAYMLLFWKLIDKNQISKPPKPTRHHNSKNYWFTCHIPYEIPCSWKDSLKKIFEIVWGSIIKQTYLQFFFSIFQHWFLFPLHSKFHFHYKNTAFGWWSLLECLVELLCFDLLLVSFGYSWLFQNC